MEELKDCTDKTIVIDGYKFTRSERDGYYRCGKLTTYLHQYIWRKHNGEIPKGYHIHHIDHNKRNNHIYNLQMISAKDHAIHHMNDLSEDRLESMRINLQVNAQPKAKEWHTSEEGSNWHREHYERMKDKLHEKHPLKCKQCNGNFEHQKRVKFCSNKCKSKWRRDNGLDDVTKPCVICGEEFVSNKYKNKQCCTRSCGGKLKWITQRTT